MTSTPQPLHLQGLKWRLIGPYRGGHVNGVVGHPSDPMTFYAGATGGGVWKTDDGGFLWQNISDGFFKRSSVGAIEVSPSHPDILYVGMGECAVIHGQTHGDGVYRSSDGGRTWQHVGLADSQTIGRIRVHPTDPNLVYVAAMGHRFGPNTTRGVYRSQNGGRSWERVLFRSPVAGAVDLAINPINPQVVYAVLWQAMQSPWTHVSGGAGSGLFKSIDGGDTWEEITHHPGLPEGNWGRAGITVSPTRPERLYALIEAEDGGVYRSDDGGLNWSWMDNNRHFLVRANYFSVIVADPLDPDTVYLPNRKLWKSIDGARSFVQLNVPYVDQHDLWVDPLNPHRMILSSDGGVSVSFNGGRSWSTLLNQPTAEIWKIAVDNHFPYRVYGSQQDNSTICLPSRSDMAPISALEWYDIGGGESGFIAVRDDNPNIVYSSDLPGLGMTRYDHSTHEIREIGPWSDPDSWDVEKLRYRFNWSPPVVLSPHSPDTLYIAANVLFRSHDEGQHWEVISHDLTRNDRDKMLPPADAVTREDSVADQFGNISSVAESPITRGVIWVGTNDGLVQRSPDDGTTWHHVTPPDMPEWAQVQVEPSVHQAGKAYLSADHHTIDDFAPYIFKTEDDGATWTRITDGLPPDQFVRVVREDPEVPGLLVAGTEAGICFSIDDGESWRPLQTNLPIAAVHDLVIRHGDIAVATHGRSMWVLDDISPLRQWAGMADQPVHLFAPRPTIRIARHAYNLHSLNAMYHPYAANNPPSGIVVYYYFDGEPESRILLQLLDEDENEIRYFGSDYTPTARVPVGPYSHTMAAGGATLKTRAAGDPDTGVKWGALTLQDEDPYTLPAEQGLNRFVIPIVHPSAWRIPGQLGKVFPPLLVPGRYLVRLTIGNQSWTQPAEVLPDPRLQTTMEAYQAQYELLIRIRDQVTRTHGVAQACRDIRRQLDDRLHPYQHLVEAAPLLALAEAIKGELNAIEHRMIQPLLNTDAGELDGAHIPTMLDGMFEELSYKVARSDSMPPKQMVDMYDVYKREADWLTARYHAIVERDLLAFHEAFMAMNWPIILAPERF